MTDRQRLALAKSLRADLTRTREGYVTHPNGPVWRIAMPKLDRLIKDLQPYPVPALGPVFAGGKSVLAHDLTHATGGIPLYPAFDDAFKAGTKIIAPEALEVTRQSSSRPGDAFYADGASGLRWWFGHLVTAPPNGRRFRKGAVLGTVLDHNIGGGPHVHVGLNVERLLGKGVELIHRTDYRHGAPLIGVQLAASLEA